MAYPFHACFTAEYIQDEQSVLLGFPVGTVTVTGPEAGVFYKSFRKQQATNVKPNGEGILSVTLKLREEAEG